MDCHNAILAILIAVSEPSAKGLAHAMCCAAFKASFSAPFTETLGLICAAKALDLNISKQGKQPKAYQHAPIAS